MLFGVIFKMKRIQLKNKIKTHQAQMTCNVEHTMVKSKAPLNPLNPPQIHGGSTKKNILLSARFKLIKRLKPAPGVGLSVLYLHTKF